jgi:hypothetical protein
MINEKLKEVVIARIQAGMPQNLRLVIGNQSLARDNIIEHVRKGDKIGMAIIKSQLRFMKAVANGEFARVINSV